MATILSSRVAYDVTLTMDGIIVNKFIVDGFERDAMRVVESIYHNYTITWYDDEESDEKPVTAILTNKEFSVGTYTLQMTKTSLY